MSFPFVRSISFVIPPLGKSPHMNITVTEINGDLFFELDLESTKNGQPLDIRGLYFNLNERQDSNVSHPLWDGMNIVGDAVSEAAFSGVSNFKNGNNQGNHNYDVGIDFNPAGAKDLLPSTNFTLSHNNTSLTLDDIANVEFGARINGSKLDVIAPAAPDAVDDVVNIFEESVANLETPSTIETGTIFHPLENDSDADDDTLTIVEISNGEFGPQHGTVEIIDGDDADNLIGDAIFYTPFEDFSGQDSFYYLVSDGNGGQDFAQFTVNIEAVADIPDLSYEILEGETVNQIVVRVTTEQTDADGSEYIDRIELSGIPETGVHVSESIFNPTDEPDAITAKDFTLTLDKESDFDFDLTVTSVAKEESNGDEETNSATFNIRYNETDNSFYHTFLANDQSMWNTGDAFQFSDDRFWGVDRSADFEFDAGVPYIDVFGTYKFGLESSLAIDGGLVDAQTPFTVDLDSYYNHTTDWLRMETNATNYIDSSWFTTSSPDLNYSLDLIGDVDMDFTIGAEVDLSKSVEVKTGSSWVDGILKDIYEWVTYTFSFDESVTLSPDFNFDLDLVTFDGQNFSFGPNAFEAYFEDSYSWDLGDFFTLTVEVPHIDASSSILDANTLSAKGTTADDGGNFIQLSFDVDKTLASLAGLPVNPLGDSVTIASLFTVGYDIVNYELLGNLDLGQNYYMDILGLDGQILFEDNSLVDFTFGDDLDFHGASDKDVNADGFVEYAVLLSPEAKFYSDLFLNPSLGHKLEIGKLSGSISTPWPFSDVSVELGPASTPVDDTLLETDIHLVNMPQFDFSFESIEVDNLVA